MVNFWRRANASGASVTGGVCRPSRYSESMPNRSSKRRPTDLNQLAASIVADAVGYEPPAEQPAAPVKEKDPLAVELGRRGGKKGGAARAAKLTPERRREIARNAAEARWSKAPQGN